MSGELQAEIDRLKSAIRKHRDQRGDDRCQLDDEELYAAIGARGDYNPILPPKCEFLESCSRFWEQRQSALTKARAGQDSPKTIRQLEEENARLLESLGKENATRELLTDRIEKMRTALELVDACITHEGNVADHVWRQVREALK